MLSPCDRGTRVDPPFATNLNHESLGDCSIGSVPPLARPRVLPSPHVLHLPLPRRPALSPLWLRREGVSCNWWLGFSPRRRRSLGVGGRMSSGRCIRCSRRRTGGCCSVWPRSGCSSMRFGGFWRRGPIRNRKGSYGARSRSSAPSFTAASASKPRAWCPASAPAAGGAKRRSRPRSSSPPLRPLAGDRDRSRRHRTRPRRGLPRSRPSLRSRQAIRGLSRSVKPWVLRLCRRGNHPPMHREQGCRCAA